MNVRGWMTVFLAAALLMQPVEMAQAGQGNGGGMTADKMIARIDQRTAKMKARIAQRAANGGGRQRVAGQGQGRKHGNKNGQGNRFERINQRLANSNMSEADKQRVRARLEQARQEVQQARQQARQQRQNGQSGSSSGTPSRTVTPFSR